MYFENPYRFWKSVCILEIRIDFANPYRFGNPYGFNIDYGLD